jgi:outer membrane protein OmpA-like peptidoglycan-associated protein
VSRSRIEAAVHGVVASRRLFAAARWRLVASRRLFAAARWRSVLHGCACLLLAAAAPARAQVESDLKGTTTIEGAGDEDSELDRWWLGGYFRHLWIPGYMTDPFFATAPSVSNNGFGATATYRTGGGLNVVMGVGYMPYEFRGPFLADGQPVTDTEIVDSSVKLIHLTGSLLWDIEFHHTIALEIGFGIDLGVLTGEIRRNEAFDDDGRFRECESAEQDEFETLDDGTIEDYCGDPDHPDSPNDPSDDYDQDGEHYDVVEERVPPVILFPMIPHVALRVQPFKHLTIKGEFAFGVVQMWAGASLQVSFGIFEKGPKEVFVPPEAEVTTYYGRVLGKVTEADTGVPIGGATVRVKSRALSPLTTEPDGRFMVDRLDVGDYASMRCEAEIPRRGGDVPVECHMVARAKVGAISGQLQAEDGSPIAGQTVQITGPRNETLTSDQRGTFAAVDLPVGAYRIKVEAEGYLVQVVEVEVVAHETAIPRVILVKKPKRSVVELRKQEIVITEQIQFKSNSAEILPESANVLRQVADVLLRHPQIERLEVQGHTDNTGTRARNMELSQSRAEAVRGWLVQAGVAAERLEAKGYGPDHPIRANDLPGNRAKNRRVQFIIRSQSAEVAE